MNTQWNWTKNEEQQQQQRSSMPTIQNAKSMIPSAAYYAPLAGMYQQMDQLFDQVRRNFGFSSVPGNQQHGAMFNPKVDISSTDREYTIEVEAPGMSENDIRIDITRTGDLCICGEKRQENDKQEKDFHRVERIYGSFSRTLSLPDDIDHDAIEASFSNGVLTITAPKMQGQSNQSRRVEVSAGESSDEASENARIDTKRDRPAQEGFKQGNSKQEMIQSQPKRAGGSHSE